MFIVCDSVSLMLFCKIATFLCKLKTATLIFSGLETKVEDKGPEQAFTSVSVSSLVAILMYYEDKSMNSDNGSISQKILLESELFVKQNVDMGFVY